MPELFGEGHGRADLLRRVGRLEQAAGVRLVTLGDGAERGVRLLEFRTGTGFAFDVVVDHAFDVGRCEMAGRSPAWQSPVGFAGPWYGEPESLGFLRNRGGGLLTTAGLDHALFMAEDTARQYHYEPKEKETYGLHGRVSGRPARLVGYGERWEGAELLAPARSVSPRGDYPAEGYGAFHGPEAGYYERVFEHDLAAEAGGTVPLAVVNRRIGRGLYEVYREDQLPHHLLWRMLGEGTYVVGIEPSTDRPAGRLDARGRGELIELAPGERRPYDLKLGALDGRDEIDRFAARVASLGSGA